MQFGVEQRNNFRLILQTYQGCFYPTLYFLAGKSKCSSTPHEIWYQFWLFLPIFIPHLNHCAATRRGDKGRKIRYSLFYGFVRAAEVVTPLRRRFPFTKGKSDIRAAMMAAQLTHHIPNFFPRTHGPNSIETILA